MFMIELLSGGGPLTVFSVDVNRNLFLIYRDDFWEWIDMAQCKPYTHPPYLTTTFTDGGTTT